MSDSYVLITGASRGIGASLARVYAKNNYNVILHGRDEDALKSVSEYIKKNYSVKCVIVCADLSKNSGVDDLLKYVSDYNVNTLINNAGFGDHGLLSEVDIDRQLKMVQVNISALIKLTKAFLKKDVVKILNVASTAAFAPGPVMSVYYASKAFVLSFSRALYVENRKKGVLVSALCPGATATDFDKNAGLSGSRLFSSGLMSSDKVAEIAYKDLEKNKAVIIPGFKNKILAFSTKIISWRMAAFITEYLNSKK